MVFRFVESLIVAFKQPAPRGMAYHLDGVGMALQERGVSPTKQCWMSQPGQVQDIPVYTAMFSSCEACVFREDGVYPLLMGLLAGTVSRDCWKGCGMEICLGAVTGPQGCLGGMFSSFPSPPDWTHRCGAAGGNT